MKGYTGVMKRNNIIKTVVSMVLMISLSFTYVYSGNNLGIFGAEFLSAGNKAGITNSVKTADASSMETELKEAGAGLVQTSGIKVESERRAMWICCFEIGTFTKKTFTKYQFTSRIRKYFKVCKKYKMTDIVAHVRPCSDALYDSDIFPTSDFIAGKQGKYMSYDPLQIMVKEAHKKNLRIEAWINPYRVTMNSTSYKSLAKTNPARQWHNTKGKKRNVLKCGNQLYYNPAKSAVRKLIIKGAKEIVKNYAVDGIHMDDYFYPNLGMSYAKNFDAKEYKSYVKKKKAAGESYMGIVNWRRENVNKLVRGLYKGIKSVNKDVEFGISPAGNIDNLYLKWSYYVDVEKWFKNSGYVDYIAPQIYWDFKTGSASYHKLSKRWHKMAKGSDVRLYTGLGVYRTIPPLSGQWKKKNILKRQVKYTRKHNYADGFYFFSYNSFVNKYNKKEIKRLKSVL
ncbi:MAG: family 10 glycosylhydrolase [Lachnospiraceae bacterium]|nr:family 10 glycosylhydrolase [Lachnospiraceae bacterium]